MRYPIAPLPMQDYPVSLDSDNGPPKPVVSRGARACTVCRAAKMKCVGAEDDGAKPCQRCRRSNSECIFEKHRRGRKPGSKISEASKQLRKIEKSSSAAAAGPAKIKSMSDIPTYIPSSSSSSSSQQPLPPPLPPPPPLLQQPQSSSSSQVRNNLFPTLTSAFPAPPPSSSSSSSSSSGRFHHHPHPHHLPVLSAAAALHHPSPPPPPPPPPPPSLPPSVFPPTASSSSPHVPPSMASSSSSSSSSSTPLALPSSHLPSSIQPSDPMEEDEEDEKDEDTMYPARMVEREGRRHSFFGTVLTNPIPKPSPALPASAVLPSSSSSSSPPVSSHHHPPHSHSRHPQSQSQSFPSASISSIRRGDERNSSTSAAAASHPPRASPAPSAPPSSSLRHQHSSHRPHHRHPYHRDDAQLLSPTNNAPSPPGQHRRPSSSSAGGLLPSSIPPKSGGNVSATAFRYFPFFNSRLLQIPTPVPDPVKTGLLSLSQVEHLFDMIFQRLNPFINLFDPALHTHTYVRDACPFLFTVLCMAGSKFFMPEKFRDVKRMAEDLCTRAFQECWKRIEVVQAFMCMTYWREPDDQRTWTFIGYAARMAVELGLNTYYRSAASSADDLPSPSSSAGGSAELHHLQRRDRERTYLVLWVHDRSLSMQTGRQWMLPEDDLVRNAVTWYRGSDLLPIDTVVAAQVELRVIAASIIDIFYLHRRTSDIIPTDANYNVILSNCNSRLQKWSDDWMIILQKTNGNDFHTAFLTFFKLHVRLFLNSFGLQSSFLVHHHHQQQQQQQQHHHHHIGTHYLHSSLVSQPPIPNMLALHTCYFSASETLELVARDFSKVDMLRYGQDSITVMTAYSAVFLLKLLRNVGQNTSIDFGENSLEHVYDLINATADAYQACAKSMSVASLISSKENVDQFSSGDPNAGERMETGPSSFSAGDDGGGDGGVATSNPLKSKGESLSSNNSNGSYHNSTGTANYDNPLVGTFNNTSKNSPFTMVFSSVEYHGRFLRTLVLKDKASRVRAAEREKRNAMTASATLVNANNPDANTNFDSNFNAAANNTTTGATSNRKSSLELMSRRISPSSLPSSTQSSNNALVLSPTTSAAASALHSFAGAGIKGLDGLATVATYSSALTLTNGTNGSSTTSPPNANTTGNVIISSSHGSGNDGTPTGQLYHSHSQHYQHSSGQAIPSPYTFPSLSSSSSHYRSHSQAGTTIGSHQVYGASSQSNHSQSMSTSKFTHSHRSSFGHVIPHPRAQPHVQHVPVQQYSAMMQQPYSIVTPGHPAPTWHFPASPHLPTHPLVSPEDELGPLDLNTVVCAPGGIPIVAASDTMYNNQPHDSVHDPANNNNMAMTDDSDVSPDMGDGGEHSNSNGVTTTGGMGADILPPSAYAEVLYWNYMHSEMGYGNGMTNMNSYAGFVNPTHSMNMDILDGEGMGLANINSRMGGQNGVNAANAMSVMNPVSGLTVSNIGGLASVGHTSLGGMSGLDDMVTTGNTNISGHGAGASVQERTGSTQTVTTAGPASDVNSKRRSGAAANDPSPMGHQHHGLSHSQAQTHPSTSHHHTSHGPNSHHNIPPAYGHSTIQNG